LHDGEDQPIAPRRQALYRDEFLGVAGSIDGTRMVDSDWEFWLAESRETAVNFGDSDPVEVVG